MAKNTLKTIIIIVLAWLILPTGDPSDFFITAPLIALLGLPLYLVLSLALAFYLYKTIKGKTIKEKFNNVKKEIKNVLGGG